MINKMIFNSIFITLFYYYQFIHITFNIFSTEIVIFYLFENIKINRLYLNVAHFHKICEITCMIEKC